MNMIYAFIIMSFMLTFNTSHADDINWIEDTSGNWFDNNNWQQGTVPVAGDRVIFNDFNIQDPYNQVNIDNAGFGVMQPGDTLVLNDKVTFVDSEVVRGEAAPIDDVMTFDLIEANGSGGKSIIFDVPVVANSMTSNRHGAVLNQPFAIDTILATSEHQDHWVINAAATAAIDYVLIDENRGADGDTIDGSFKINADLKINHLEFVWGSLQVGADTELTVGQLTYHAFAEQQENNNLSPIIIGENSRIKIEKLIIIDVANGEIIEAQNAVFGSETNADVEVNTVLIEGPGVIVVCQQSIFANSFEQNSQSCAQ